MNNNQANRIKAAVELIDDLTLQLFGTKADVEWLSEQIATLQQRHAKSTDVQRRYPIRKQLRMLLNAKFFSEMHYVSLQNNRELVIIRLAEWRQKNK